MDFRSLILLAVKISIVMIVLGLGLKASMRDVTYLLRRPGELVRSLLAMNVLMPIVAIALVMLFDLHPAVKFALIGLSLSPVPPFLPMRAEKTAGNASYAVGLLVANALFSIIFIPFVMKLLPRIFAIPMEMTMGAVARILAVSVLVPLLIGIAIRKIAPTLAEKLAKPVARVGTISLLVACVPVLIAVFPPFVSLIGDGLILVLTAFVIIAVIGGHILGGPDPHDRTMLAVATASRHPAIAIAIASTNFAQQKLVAPIVLMYLLLSAVVSAPYVLWAKKRNTDGSGEWLRTRKPT